MNNEMSRSELISGVSIQCGISRQEAESILNSIFRNISNSLNGGKDVKIKSFGEFKPRAVLNGIERTDRTEFKPAKKLNSKINKLYEYLSPSRKIYDKIKLENIYNEFGIIDFVPFDNHSEKENEQFERDKINTENNLSENNELPEKRLISDKLIDLHNDIVNTEKKSSKKNLWG
ncbi:MAG: HU family DNA-binding protein [Ignavibacteria bacterium]